jgi:hypothetical protein
MLRFGFLPPAIAENPDGVMSEWHELKSLSDLTVDSNLIRVNKLSCPLNLQ